MPPTPIPPPGDHGGDAPRIAAALGVDPASLLDLSQTLNPMAPDVVALLVRHAAAVRQYPDATDATRVAAEVLGVDPERLLLTAGGSSAISLVAAELGGTVAAEPDFSLYPRSGSGPIWRSDPHSPSGVLAASDEGADVWDEAFYPLATGRWTAGRSGIVVGSFTKVFACPGLRLGYLVADEVERFSRHQPAWPIGSLSLAVLVDLLASADPVGWSDAIAATRSELVDLLESSGYAVTAADAPWVLVDGARLRTELAHRGIVVRSCATFGMPTVVRIAVPDPAGLERLAAALATIARH